MIRLHFRSLLPAAGIMLGLSCLLVACNPAHKTSDVSHEVSFVAEKLDTDFLHVRTEVEKLAAQVAALYPRRKELAALADASLYAFSPDGSFYKKTHTGGASLWISAVVPITPEVREVAYFTEAIDPELVRLCRDNAAICQAYYNDRHSLNRMYPWLDVVAQFPARMNIPEFNFYYLADAVHNPGKTGVWVDEPYVDPAGGGWMVSAIAPVYVDGVLEGVAGLDVSISALVDLYFSKSDDSVVIISRSGVIVAATEAAIQDLEMPPLRNHKYLETVKLDTFRPDEYNIRKSTLRPIRELARRLLDGHETHIELELNGRPHIACAAPVTAIGWIVIELSSPHHAR
ncbi:PDC sensor domain-containing protein [Rariglobus hedericola]|uniref:Cache domain-containing protein n=1 Tax=Rariglobus hedericola TaxID=2597822 RepID=A0A556QPM6_9BACT|nr:cache domain-containing protein [Rariglobus hedericola]TSJ78598.1 hypothetical protein FPL22_04660 [Rariglobus hedericola]